MKCPLHNTRVRKRYNYGSTMSAETDVYVFIGCPCTVAERHDPVGTYPSVVSRHDTFAEASGVARLHAMQAAVKYRD